MRGTRRTAATLGLLLLALLLAALPAQAELRLNLAGQAPPPLTEIILRGTNRGDAPALVVLRIDDTPSPPYADRVNVEQYVPPGPFALRLRLALLATPRGRALNPATLRHAIAFAPRGGPVAFEALALDEPPALPEGVRGWSFAPAGAAPLSGMETIAPDDPRLSGPGPRPVRRPGQDPVLARGMAGITRFATPLPAGRWRVTLWTEDAGEWETLPPILEHRVRINGQTVLMLRRPPETWIAERYLAGRAHEPAADAAPWDAIGARRGGRIEGVVPVGAEGLVVELAGHPRAATHLAAILAEPADAPPAAAATLEALREARFAEAWPVLSRPPATRATALAVTAEPAPRAARAEPRSPAAPANATLAGATVPSRPAEPPPAIVAPGGFALLRFRAEGPGPLPATATLDWQGGALPTRLFFGHWRWRRPAPETPGLVLSPAHLRADLDALTLPADLPREIVALVGIPADAPPGPRQARLLVTAGGASAGATVALEVLPLARPEPRARIGVWLDHAPQYLALRETRALARQQAGCDIATLAGLGLTAIAPPLATPSDEASLAEFLDDLRAAADRFAPPIVAYAPLRRLAERLGPQRAAQALMRAEAAIAAAGLPRPAWTIADEPTAGGTDAAARALALAIREAGSDAALAGHLNDPGDARLAPLLALATVNHRYGADPARIAALRAAGVAPWLYNLPRLRLSGGFFLWRVGADGLLKWHARMPTADAFDPTDGREGDVQFLWPPRAPCAPPDLDAELLELVEAAEDLRWLAWLDAAPGAEAAALRARLRAEVPDAWDRTAALPADAPRRWRAAIEEVARGR